MNRRLLKILALLSLLFISVGSTVAYLTDVKQEVNVMTLGRVEIDLIEQERNAAGGLVDFEDFHPLYPGYYPHGLNKFDGNGYWVDVNNAIDKVVTVQNTGKAPAYVRLWFAFEVTDDQTFFNQKIHLNKNDNDWQWEFIQNADGSYQYLSQNGTLYVVAMATYNQVLEPNATTPVSLRQVLLDSSATNDDYLKLGDKYSIFVVAQAMQTVGFDNAATALAEGFGMPTLQNHPFDGMTETQASACTHAEHSALIAAGKQCPGCGKCGHTYENGQCKHCGATLNSCENTGHSWTISNVSQTTHTLTCTVCGESQKDVHSRSCQSGNACWACNRSDVTMAYPGVNHGIAAFDWDYDTASHWRYCCDCETRIQGNAHNSDGANGACSDCGYQGQSVNPPVNACPPYQHSWEVTTVGQTTHTLTCTVCGEKMSEIHSRSCQSGNACKTCGHSDVTMGYDSIDHGIDSSQWVYDSDSHWLHCCDCGVHIQGGVHNTNGNNGSCSVCVNGTSVNDSNSGTYGSFTWVSYGKSVGITQYLGNDSVVKIPGTINGLPVTVIAQAAFASNADLTEVQIPASVTEIGYGAFYSCTALKNIALPVNLEEIDGEAFSHCKSLSYIDLPASVTSIGSEAFFECSNLESITIPNGVTRIEYQTFYNCASLKSITLPNGVTQIDSYAFNKCTSLKNITLPESVNYINPLAFEDCDVNLTIHAPSASYVEGWCAENGIKFQAL